MHIRQVEEFLEYDKSHPEIWEEFERTALDLIASGRKRYGAKAIMEVIRFNTAIRGGQDFKINNSYTAIYARKFIVKHPDKDGFFETRRKKAV